ESCQWAVFLRNHDELTLEMVTDEERDYMYRVYARDPHARINLGIRRRLAPLLGNHRRRIEIMNFLLFSLPGTPIIYYGDEIGMGDNYYLGDRDGVRTPMQWSGDRNAGFSRANPQRLYLPVIIDPEYHYEAVNVENQERNHASLLWWMKRVIAMRKQFQAFGRGNIEFVSSDNPKVISFVRQYNGQAILVVVNLSRFSQVVKLDLARFAGYVPEEVFSRNRFPCIRESYYTLTLGFHDYFWFLLSKEPETLVSEKRHDPVELIIRGDLRRVFDDRNKERIEKEILPQYLKDCRWFGGKARRIQRTTIVENIILKTPLQDTRMLFLEVVYSEGLSDMYLVPLSFASKERSEKIMRESPKALICRVKNEEKEGILYDGVYDAGFRENLLLHMARRFTVKGMHGEVSGCPGNLLKSLNRTKTLPLTKSQVLQTEQSNTSFLYEDSLFLKLFRHIEEGINPDLEIGKFLTEKAGFTHIPSFAGAVEYRRTGCEPIVLGILQEFVPNEGDAWKYTLHSLELYYSNILTNMGELRETPKLSSSLPDIASSEPHPLLQEVIGGVYSEMIRLLGRRTGEVHLALSQDSTDSEFRPEPFSLLYQRSLYQSMQSLTKRILGLLQERLRGLPPETRDKAKKVLSMEDEIINRFSPLLKKKVSAMKIRIHGDYHLGQVLFTGNDFVIIDFEGEPARALSERRLKRSPLRDVAGMIRSFHYAAHMSLFKEASLRPEDIPPLEQWADLWYKGISGIFLRSYLDTVSDALFLPSQEEELNAMLQAFLMEKAVYELGYELNNRPDWIIIPIKGIEDLLEVER
ncbi:MAG: putative maltokinase, partial [Thermodesulfobacteriota bacterium]|nr:putative maltokinase [Thermodesulfobacteriota bacterium]